MTQAERDDSCRIKIGEQLSKEGEQMSNGNSERMDSRGVENGENHGSREIGHMNMMEMAIRVGTKMVKLPLTYATILGIIYSLIAGRYFNINQAPVY